MGNAKKVTIRISLKAFLESKKKRTEKLIEKTGHETQGFWAGYNQCCQDLLQKYFPVQRLTKKIIKNENAK